MPSRPSSPRLRPFIAELLRTCVHPDSLLLRLEKVVIQTLDHDGAIEAERDENGAGRGKEKSGKEVYRLWLTDGELMVQAVLEQPLHHIFETEECALGSLLDIKRFRVRRGKRLHSSGEVVYLAIADYETVLRANPATSTQTHDLNEGGFIREESQSPNKKRRLSSNSAKPLRHSHSPSSQESDGFETAQVDPEILDRRRQTLHELSTTIELAASWDAFRNETPRKRRKLPEKKEVPDVTSSAPAEGAVGFANVDREKSGTCYTFKQRPPTGWFI